MRRKNKPGVLQYRLLGKMSTWTHTRTISLMSERASRNKGKQVEVRGEGGEDCGKRGRRERRSGVSPGELQTSVTQHSLSTVAGRLLLLLLLVERHKAQKVSSHTHTFKVHMKPLLLDTHICCRGRVTIVTQ